jgi:outer membrane protein W
MERPLIVISFIIIFYSLSFPQNQSNQNDSVEQKVKTFISASETNNSWAINILFSDNGFGAGATMFQQLSKNVFLFESMFFSGAKDDREFEATDIFGNTFIPNKVNRIFMTGTNIGLQIRLFRDDVTDNLRPHLNFGISPTALIYTPYDKAFFPSFNYAKAKYTVGAFAGIGVDYLTGRKSSLNMDIRYYYTKLFGSGIESLKDNEKKYFGGLYFVFSYNFMK